jgi:N-methylhydantoinase B
VTREALDPFAVEVIGNALLSIAEEMGEALVRASYSTNIKERRDCSTALFDAQGSTLVQAEHIPIHLSSLLGIVATILERYPLSDVRPGDMFIGNDPYTGGGTHLPDIVVAAPMFYEGSLIGFVANLAHHADFVDRGTIHIFVEGIRIPPVKIFDRGELQKDVLDLILTNLQMPHERLGDFRAQFAANRLGLRRFGELCDRHGKETLLAAAEELLNYAERKTRAGILQIPDGVYEFTDYFDAPSLPEPLLLRVKIEVKGDEMHLDFSGNPPQMRNALNMTWTALLATVYYAAKTLIDPTILPNAGLYRPIEVTAPKGSILNCRSPAAVRQRTETCQRVVDLIYGALAPAVPERVTAAHNGANTGAHFFGLHPRSGQFFNYMETIGGGFGARATKDGLDGVQVHITNTSNLPVECLESDYPLLVKRYEMVKDSGGPGKWRGGMAIHRQIKVVEGEIDFGAEGSRQTVPPWGLFGGKPGAVGKVVVHHDPSQAGERSRPSLLYQEESVSIITPGAGGYGDPRERDHALVLRDLIEEKISKESAIRDYGLNPDEIPDEIDRHIR